MNSLRKYGLFMTLFKAFRFLARRFLAFFREQLFYKREIEKKVKENGLRVGRLSMFFGPDRLDLYWDNVRLTRAEGFTSSLGVEKAKSSRPSPPWNLERKSENEALLKRREDSFTLDEIWKIKIIDEKQIDWRVNINVKKPIEIPDKKLGVILTQRYHRWVDAWGEGLFPPINDYSEAELKNPRSSFIGLRGRKKLRGQLPTILLDLSDNNGGYAPSVKNSPLILGARMLQARASSSNGDGKYLPGEYELFSGRIKIVEEDFNKRKLNNKK